MFLDPRRAKTSQRKKPSTTPTNKVRTLKDVRRLTTRFEDELMRAKPPLEGLCVTPKTGINAITSFPCFEAVMSGQTVGLLNEEGPKRIKTPKLLHRGS